MNIKVQANITQLNSQVSNKILIYEVEKKIKKEIRTTFSKGIGKKLEVLFMLS